ncbi:Putative transposase [Magnetospirillum gryphiswaldense MSR-1 v2]|uniref:Transposase n=1 Tax=Magnetospirillum gryphiswaldense (strain DSM 6361 / JCM 21280 / NBRC 15271 / MSR-1) TaxID=431944 RepID=V6F0T2_MAGGM|nr:Putative transposase [Magnetospirillum gryphiswaldense MSR-1 v2]
MPRKTPGQHFLLSAKARSLSLRDVMRMTDEEAMAMFRAIRWASTEGEAVCPECGCVACYAYASRPIFKCKGCGKQFSVTSGTIFASRKLTIRDYLLAIVIFINAAKGISSLQLARDLGVQYKTAFVLTHKLREAMAAELRGMVLNGTVEVDGCYVGGHVRPANRKVDRVDRRLAENMNGKRKCVVVMRQREGRTLPFALTSEAEGVSLTLCKPPSSSSVSVSRRQPLLKGSGAIAPSPKGGSRPGSRPLRWVCARAVSSGSAAKELTALGCSAVR